MFKESGALLSGHFLLSSGLHSDQYLQAALVLQWPSKALALAGELAKRFHGERVSVIIGPAVGGITFAFAVAQNFDGCRALFAERENGIFSLRRGYALEEKDRVLVVEDVITTGGSTREVIQLAGSFKAEVVGVGAIAERSAEPVDFNVRKEVLLRLPLKTFTPDLCPLCRQSVPLVKPGSRKPGTRAEQRPL